MRNFIENINDLPSLNEVKERSQGLALLDAIIMPQWEFRYFSFNSNWDGDGKEMMASMRDGSGCEYFLHFSEHGVVGKVLADERLLDVEAALKNIPINFSSFKTEPAFSVLNASFFFWRGVGDNAWFSSPANATNFPLLGFLCKTIDFYQGLVKDYYEKNVDAELLKEVFESLSVTPDQLKILNSNLTLDALVQDLHEIFNT